MANENAFIDYDVIVIGAGPGGSACASFCAIKGLKTLLVDKQKFPREKICGDALSGKSIEVLEKLDLIKDIEKQQHAYIKSIIFSGPNGKEVEISFEKEKGDYHGYCIKRIYSDNVIYQKAKKLCDTIEEFEVIDLKYEKEFVEVIGLDKKTNSQKAFKAKLVVGADGAYSKVAKINGLDKIEYEHHCTALRTYFSNVKGNNKEHAIELHFVEEAIPGYFWIFPVGNNEWNVGIGMITKDMQERRVNLKDVLMKVIESEKFKERFKDAKMIDSIKGWTLPFGSKKRKMYSYRTMLVGDAAQLIDPFTGEGQGNALVSGLIASEVAKMANKKNDFSEEFLKIYNEKVYETLWNELNTSYQLQKMSKFKWLLNFVISKAAKSEKVRETITSMLSGRKPKNHLFNPLFYIELLFS
ncbi:MAG: geranylgeranyl reductase family protein [Candidatus Anstonellales archaeon]